MPSKRAEAQFPESTFWGLMWKFSVAREAGVGDLAGVGLYLGVGEVKAGGDIVLF